MYILNINNPCTENTLGFLYPQDAVRELLTIQEQNRAELRISGNALQEEIHAREALERRLCELRGEVN